MLSDTPVVLCFAATVVTAAADVTVDVRPSSTVVECYLMLLLQASSHNPIDKNFCPKCGKHVGPDGKCNCGL
jgi:hypothetical protein